MTGFLVIFLMFFIIAITVGATIVFYFRYGDKIDRFLDKIYDFLDEWLDKIETKVKRFK